MQQSNKGSKIAKIIEATILPMIVRNGMRDVWITMAQWNSDETLPTGIELTYKGEIGKRIAIRNKRSYGTHNVFDARWPQDNLVSSRAPRIFFILSTSATLQIADYLVHCRRGSVLIIPPRIPHQWSRELSPHPQEALHIMPYYGGILCWHTAHGKSREEKPWVHEDSCSIPQSQVVYPLSQLMEEISADGKFTNIICESYLKISLSLLCRELQSFPILQIESDITETRDLEKHPIRDVEEYIHRNLHRKLSIDNMARYAYISRTAFTTQFRTHTGKTFNQYLQDLRFETACQFLREGDLTIEHIASAVGLHTNRLRGMFRERLQSTPSEYRQRHRKKHK